jgi:hypothetical protein
MTQEEYFEKLAELVRDGEITFEVRRDGGVFSMKDGRARLPVLAVAEQVSGKILFHAGEVAKALEMEQRRTNELWYGSGINHPMPCPELVWKKQLQACFAA